MRAQRFGKSSRKPEYIKMHNRHANFVRVPEYRNTCGFEE